MTPVRTTGRRALKTGVKAVTGGLAAVTLILAALLAYPNLLFAHSVSTDRIAIYSDRPFDRQAALAVARDVEARLDTNGFRIGGPYALFLANTTWRRMILWNVIASRDAGGFAAYPVSRRNVFLSGADFAADRLIAPDGTVIPPKRTLTYYMTHEIVHVLTGEDLGALDYLQLPNWIREGVADHAAFPDTQPLEALRKAIGSDERGPPFWAEHGFYADHRYLVRHFLEWEGWTRDRLLASGLSEVEARRRAGLAD